MDSDITLSFDPKLFLGAMNKISESLDRVVKNTEALGKTTEKVVDEPVKKLAKTIKSDAMPTAIQFGKNMGKMLIGMALQLAPIALAIAAIRKAMSYIPEIGRAFSIAGDIISRNLLWPLRRELAPILQRMLNWVRDHRAMFVRWGTTLVSIFRIVKSVVVGIIDAARSLWNGLISSINRAFRTTIGSIEQIVNIMIFHMAIVIAGVQALFGLFVDWFVTNVMRPVLNAIARITEGFMEWGPNISEATRDIMTAVGRIVSIFGRLFSQIGNTDGAMRRFGSYCGEILTGILNAVAFGINLVARAMLELEYMQALHGVTGNAAETARIRALYAPIRSALSEDIGRNFAGMGFERTTGPAVASSRIEQLSGAAIQGIAGVSLAGGVRYNEATGAGSFDIVHNNQRITININGTQNVEAVRQAVMRAIQSSSGTSQ